MKMGNKAQNNTTLSEIIKENNLETTSILAIPQDATEAYLHNCSLYDNYSVKLVKSVPLAEDEVVKLYMQLEKNSTIDDYKDYKFDAVISDSYVVYIYPIGGW